MRPRFLLLSALALALASTRAAQTANAQSAASLRLPFPAGTTWKVIQGYNGGTHVPGPERYALDFVRDDGGPTAGVEVLAPASGTMWWMNGPGGGNGCLLIKIDGGGGLIVEMCHIIARSFRRDERIEVGQVVGTLGPAGTVGNNGLAHMHISLHRTYDYGVTRIPAPFAAPDGLPLEGIALPADGSVNQYVCPGRSCRSGLVSSNTPGGARTLTPVAPPPAVVGSFSGPASQTGVPLRAGVVARVAGAGAGDCMNVREGPGLRARALSCLPDGIPVTIAGGPINADGRTWWQLHGLGWSAGDYLVGVSGPVLRVGGRAVVDAGPGDCLNLRTAPGLGAGVVTCLPSGARLTITDGPREADGHRWWQLDGRGWVVAEFLDPDA